MSTDHDVCAAHDRLQHGEILSNAVEFVATRLDDDGTPVTEGVVHDLVVVLTPECDLVSDYETRDEAGLGPQPIDGKLSIKELPRVLCCDLFVGASVKETYGFTSRPWSTIRDNRDDRYHWIPTGDVEGLDLPELFLDFKRVLSLSTEHLYRSVLNGSTQRCGVIPPPWITRLVQRCYGFQGRVCLPDPSDPRPSAQTSTRAIAG